MSQAVDTAQMEGEIRVCSLEHVTAILDDLQYAVLNILLRHNCMLISESP